MPSLTLRLSDELHAELVRAASASGRSLQREIIVRLDGRVPAVLPLREASPGGVLPDLPEDAYPEGSVALPPVRPAFPQSVREFKGPDPKGGKK